MWPLLSLALANVATFDLPPEGTTSRMVVEDGITLRDLDNRLDPPPGVMTVEQATATLSGFPGFTPENALGFGGYVPGTSAAFGRFGQLTITGPDGADAASVEVWDFGNSAVDLTLQAWDAGAVVAADHTALSSLAGVQHHTLRIQATPFSELRLVCGPTTQVACFILIDTVRIGRTAAPTDTADTDATVDTPPPDAEDTPPVDTEAGDTDRADADPADTDLPQDTDGQDTDRAPDDATDTPNKDLAAPGGCGCATAPGPDVSALALLLIARRRRPR